jgi:hypothetical protein
MAAAQSRSSSPCCCWSVEYSNIDSKGGQSPVKPGISTQIAELSTGAVSSDFKFLENRSPWTDVLPAFAALYHLHDCWHICKTYERGWPGGLPIDLSVCRNFSEIAARWYSKLAAVCMTSASSNGVTRLTENLPRIRIAYSSRSRSAVQRLRINIDGRDTKYSRYAFVTCRQSNSKVCRNAESCQVLWWLSVIVKSKPSGALAWRPTSAA